MLILQMKKMKLRVVMNSPKIMQLLFFFFSPPQCVEAPWHEPIEAVLTTWDEASRVLWSTRETWQATDGPAGVRMNQDHSC